MGARLSGEREREGGAVPEALPFPGASPESSSAQVQQEDPLNETPVESDIGVPDQVQKLAASQWKRNLEPWLSPDDSEVQRAGKRAMACATVGAASGLVGGAINDAPLSLYITGSALNWALLGGIYFGINEAGKKLAPQYKDTWQLQGMTGVSTGTVVGFLHGGPRMSAFAGWTFGCAGVVGFYVFEWMADKKEAWAHEIASSRKMDRS